MHSVAVNTEYLGFCLGSILNAVHLGSSRAELELYQDVCAGVFRTPIDLSRLEPRLLYMAIEDILKILSHITGNIY